jgi:hypothetical protein
MIEYRVIVGISAKTEEKALISSPGKEYMSVLIGLSGGAWESFQYDNMR